MGQSPESTHTWRQAVQAVAGAWRPLVIYELLSSWLAVSVLGPLILILSYRLIELTGEPVIANSDLARFLLTPIGSLALVSSVSVALGLLLIEYAGLILLADGALRGLKLSVRQVVASIAGAAPRLLGLAVFLTFVAILAALPFLGLAFGTYWLLLSDTDINFYLAERPPRFWVAAAVGVVLAVGFAGSMIWLFARWAIAVPACVLDGHDSLAALRMSWRLMCGRTRRLLLMIGGWQVLKYVVLLAAVAALDQANKALLSRLDGGLSTIVGCTLALLLFDSIVLQLLGTIFAIGLAVLIAGEYEQARRTRSEPATAGASDQLTPPLPTRSTWRARAAIVAVMILGPLVSVVYALTLASELVDHRPVRVTGHRAGSKAAPENSLAALRLSIEAGADYVEIDVQQTADGHVVLLHDRDLRRVTGDARNLNEVNLADLKELRLRDEHGLTDERIPTLAEFLAACDDTIRLNVELKETSRNPQLSAAVVKVLREHGYTNRAIVSCFELPALIALRRAEPALPIGIILSAGKGDVTRLRVDFLSLHQRLVRASLVRRAHERGMDVHAWTVNDRESALRVLDLGCDNLLSSDPALMREVVDWYAGLGDAERIVMRLRRWMRD